MLKRNRGPLQTSNRTSSSFTFLNQFVFLLDNECDTEDIGVPPQPNSRKSRIPPIVICIYLNNHSATLKKVNEKLATPVIVKSKSYRLLLYTKSVTDYSVHLAEIQTAKLANRTYPLPNVIQAWLVLKGIPPNVPVDEIQAELTAQELQVVKISQITKTDKSMRTLITKYPVFVVTFQPGTDVHEVLQIKKLCHCNIRWEKYKNTKPVLQCFNFQSFCHSSNFCGKPPKCVKYVQPHVMQECKSPIGTPPKFVNCGGAHLAIFTDCHSYQQQLNFLHQQQPCLPKLTTPAFQFKQAHIPALKPLTSPPRLHKRWAQAASQPTTPMDPQCLSSVLETVKSILALFDIQKLCQTLRSLVLQLQMATNPLSKIMVVLDAVVTCFLSSV